MPRKRGRNAGHPRHARGGTITPIQRLQRELEQQAAKARAKDDEDQGDMPESVEPAIPDTYAR